jgi:hypothetical protein
MNDAALNILEQLIYCIRKSFSVLLRELNSSLTKRRIARLFGNYVFYNCQVVFHSGYFAFLPGIHKGSNFSASLPTIVNLLLFFFSLYSSYRI